MSDSGSDSLATAGDGFMKNTSEKMAETDTCISLKKRTVRHKRTTKEHNILLYSEPRRRAAHISEKIPLFSKQGLGLGSWLAAYPCPEKCKILQRKKIFINIKVGKRT